MGGILGKLRRTCWDAVHDTSAALGFGIASYRPPLRTPALDVVRKLKREREMLLTPLEATQLFSLVSSTSKLGGAIAEIGVFRGASARLIREADSQRPLHLFDTFEGLPEPADEDAEFGMGRFQKGQFCCSLNDVQRYIGAGNGVYFHKGLFPATGSSVQNERFSLVHSDVDLYESARCVLEFFYPRLLPGGVILTHDYHTCTGPHKAFEEFFAALPEPVIELPGNQAMIVKLGPNGHGAVPVHNGAFALA